MAEHTLHVLFLNLTVCSKNCEIAEIAAIADAKFRCCLLKFACFLFLVLFAYHAQADEDQWYVEEFDTFVVTAKNGEVTYGDKLRFFMNKGDCERMGILFSFTTMKNHNDHTSFISHWCTLI